MTDDEKTAEIEAFRRAFEETSTMITGCGHAPARQPEGVYQPGKLN